VKKIGSTNPISDFNQMINDRRYDRVESAITQMIPIIEDYIRRSRNGDLYEDALDCIRVLRQACVREDEAVYFN